MGYQCLTCSQIPYCANQDRSQSNYNLYAGPVWLFVSLVISLRFRLCETAFRFLMRIRT
jgi:hypothetical protein